MALLGIYVGVIPVSLGMLWLPFVRRVGAEWLRALIAFTVGLLAFLAVDAGLEGLEIAGDAPSGVRRRRARLPRGADRLPGARRESTLDAPAPRGRRPRRARRAPTWRCWSRSGSASTTSARGWRSVPRTRPERSPSAPSWSSASRSTTRPRAWRSWRRWQPRGRASAAWSCSGLIAGAPAILGAWIGAAAFNPSVAALLFGVGVGAIAQVIVQLAPSMRDESGRLLHPGTVGGLLAGVVVLYLTGPAGGGLRWRTPASGAIPTAANSEAVEDYAKAIYALAQRGEGAVATSALAERLGVSPGSVTAMLKRMGEMGLVDHELYRGVEPDRRRASASRSR